MTSGSGGSQEDTPLRDPQSTIAERALSEKQERNTTLLILYCFPMHPRAIHWESETSRKKIG